VSSTTKLGLENITTPLMEQVHGVNA
jgi:hypothetical protein